MKNPRPERPNYANRFKREAIRFFLPLNPARAVSGGELFHFIHCYAVEIALDGMLQRGRGDGKFNRVLRIHPFAHRVNQPRAKAVADFYRCTLPEPSPAASFLTSSTVTRLKSPSTECFSADAATANSIASCGFIRSRIA